MALSGVGTGEESSTRIFLALGFYSKKIGGHLKSFRLQIFKIAPDFFNALAVLFGVTVIQNAGSGCASS
jgi:hypothetical protein